MALAVNGNSKASKNNRVSFFIIDLLFSYVKSLDTKVSFFS